MHRASPPSGRIRKTLEAGGTEEEAIAASTIAIERVMNATCRLARYQGLNTPAPAPSEGAARPERDIIRHIGEAMILDIDEIPQDAANETLMEQARARQEFLPRLTNPALVEQMKREIDDLLRRRARRGD